MRRIRAGDNREQHNETRTTVRMLGLRVGALTKALVEL